MKVRESAGGLTSPEVISSLLGNALYGDQEHGTRYLALAAANYHDARYGTEYGKMVISKLMRQSRQKFEITDADQSPVVSNMVPAASEGANTIREVALAIGSSIGAKIVIAEMLGDPSRHMFVTDMTDEEVKYYLLPSGEPNITGFSHEKPYLIAYQGSRQALLNLGRAVQAVVGGPQPVSVANYLPARVE